MHGAVDTVNEMTGEMRPAAGRTAVRGAASSGCDNRRRRACRTRAARLDARHTIGANALSASICAALPIAIDGWLNMVEYWLVVPFRPM